MSKHSRLVLLLENSVLLVLGRYSHDRELLRKAFEVLHHNRWYEELDMPLTIFKSWMNKSIKRYKSLNDIELFKHFKYNSECIKKEISSHYYHEYTLFLEKLVAIDTSVKESSFLKLHYAIFPFVKAENETPMLGLCYHEFFDYIQALMIYAASDNQDFNLHQNETMMIMNEIKSYIMYRPVEDTRPSDMFFAILEVAKNSSKNHISTRFEGIVKKNLKNMTDAQDAYFLKKLKTLQKADGVHSVQEKTFDQIIEKSVEKMEPYEAKEREAQQLLESFLHLHNPFSQYDGENSEVLKGVPEEPKEAVHYLWRSIEGIMLIFYDKYHIMDINKKNLYFLFTKKEFDLEVFEYLVMVRELVNVNSMIKWDQESSYIVVEVLSQIYRCFEVEDESFVK